MVRPALQRLYAASPALGHPGGAGCVGGEGLTHAAATVLYKLLADGWTYAANSHPCSMAARSPSVARAVSRTRKGQAAPLTARPTGIATASTLKRRASAKALRGALLPAPSPSSGRRLRSLYGVCTPAANRRPGAGEAAHAATHPVTFLRGGIRASENPPKPVRKLLLYSYRRTLRRFAPVYPDDTS
jgi:hypothetical protein